ncbi:putative xyloglucan:xyloglucosyl transferase [Hibiscus syriacus]|uniref:Xyloglucan:xyloglucosyl transferase n=1 Tax=Hibiscus syriacus TaxID=106335 RepID=A0A6A3C7H0_HIBSY|nr:putative xyloglucan:xyloglucosyl transferase [Hibiscus syriacus]
MWEEVLVMESTFRTHAMPPRATVAWNQPPSKSFTTCEPTNNIDTLMTEDDHEIAASLLMLANGAPVSESECGTSYHPGVQETEPFAEHLGAHFRFECPSCKKVFGSPQAGHRTSHKNAMGCFAITRSNGYNVVAHSRDDNGMARENVEDYSKLMMVWGHKCRTCLRVFSSGQALDGHMRRYHWEKGNETSLNQGLNLLAAKEDCGLDLNLPAPIEIEPSSSYSSSLALDLRLSL